MTFLPREILLNVFAQLEDTDLKQCQLTNQQWYTAATEKLYRKVNITKSENAISFIHTIKSYPAFGSLVKEVNICFSYNKYDEEMNTWEIVEILNHVIVYCPHLSQFSTQDTVGTAYWERLRLAGHRNELKNLQRLQSIGTNYKSINCYNCTALAFRKTLRKLDIRDACTTQLVPERIPGQYINKSGFFQLYERLHEFTCLQELSIYRHSNEGIVGADAIIEKCHSSHLTSVSLFISPLPGYNTFENVGNEDAILSTRPCPKVNRVEALCDITNYDDGLNYLMHKFPNPSYLRLWSFSSAGGFRAHDLYPLNPPSISSDVTKRFFDYLHRIHSFSVECTCKDMNMLIDFMIKNKNRMQKKIILEYNLRQPNLEFLDNITKVRFSPKADMSIMPHTKFFEDAGHFIRSLSVLQIETVQYHLSSPDWLNPAIYNMVFGQWFFHLLDHCPHLIELTMKGMGEFRLHDDDVDSSNISRHKQQHMSLERLTIFMHNILLPSILNDLSWLLPCLTHVHFIFYWRFYGTNVLPGTVRIYMPHTAFDTLTLEKYLKALVSSNHFIFYIKVTTTSSSSYYIADIEKAKRCTKELYNKATNAATTHLAIDIKCKSIKTLRLMYGLNFIVDYSLNIESSL